MALLINFINIDYAIAHEKKTGDHFIWTVLTNTNQALVINRLKNVTLISIFKNIGAYIGKLIAF